MLKVGVVGVGGISMAHIPAWEAMEDVELIALCDIREERLSQFAGKHLYTDFDEMLEKEDLDILDICLPTFLHVEHAVKAMERGIHVLCEKPVSLKEEDVEKVYSCARKNGVKFMVAQLLRFMPEYDLLKQIVDSGRYGRVLSGSMSRLGGIPKWSWDGWMGDEARSGLVPFDLHIHDLDFLVYAFGAPEKMVPHRSKRPDQDYLHVVYEYGDFFVSTEASWYASPYPFTAAYRFQFEHAVVALEGGKCVAYEENGKVLELLAGGNVPKEGDAPEGIRVLPNDAFGNELRYFADCVRENKPADKVKQEEIGCVLKLLLQVS